jgi:hypothetical protein
MTPIETLTKAAEIENENAHQFDNGILKIQESECVWEVFFIRDDLEELDPDNWNRVATFDHEGMAEMYVAEQAVHKPLAELISRFAVEPELQSVRSMETVMNIATAIIGVTPATPDTSEVTV